MVPEATFGHAWFGGATFTDTARFDEATFTGDARFDEATFTGTARFDEATFTGDATFDEATFTGGARFDGAILSGPAQFDRAQVLNLDDPALSESGDMPVRIWPDGWTVRTNADDSTRGTLVPEPPGSSLEPTDG